MTVLIQLLGPCDEVDAVRDRIFDALGPCIENVDGRTFPDGAVAHWCADITEGVSE